MRRSHIATVDDQHVRNGGEGMMVLEAWEEKMGEREGWARKEGRAVD